MGRRAMWGVLLLLGCAGVEKAPGEAGRSLPAGPDHRFVDLQHGFEIERPAGDAWHFSEGRDAPEGITIPVAVVHAESGAQVVVQIAPSVATAWEFAERLSEGLSQRQGFQTTAPQSLQGGAVEFAFVVDDQVMGRVGVRSEEERTFVLLGTWPKDAPRQVVEEIDAIMGSLRPVIVWRRSYASSPALHSHLGRPGARTAPQETEAR